MRELTLDEIERISGGISEEVFVNYWPNQSPPPSTGGWYGDSGRGGQSYDTDNETSDYGAYFDDIAYQGALHDKVVDQLAKDAEALGAIVAKEFSLTFIGYGAEKITARADLMIKDPSGRLSVIEVKTGYDPTFTPNQIAVYTHLSVPGAVVSSDFRSATFGLNYNMPLPPTDFYIAYTPDENSPPEIRQFK